MIVFLRCFVESAGEVGLKGLAGLVPGGDLVYDLAEKTRKKYRAALTPDEQRSDLQKLLPLDFEQARREVAEAATGLTLVPAGAGGPGRAPEDLVTLELYAAGIPEAFRQSLKRPDDLSGTTLPYDYLLASEDDVVRMLPPRPPKFRPGDTLPGRPGMVLLKALGTGGFGEVWLAEDKKVRSLRGAVKFCHGRQGADLIHEAQLIDRVMEAGPHPNIVPLIGVHLEGESPWLMFEYVPGGTLTDEIHRLAGLADGERLSEAVRLFREILSALRHCHDLPRPLVHRDLKPSNVLRDATGRLRLTDFGIGAVVARHSLLAESRNGGTRGGRLLTWMRGSHTALYASSQQRGGADATPRDDVHALGVISRLRNCAKTWRRTTEQSSIYLYVRIF